MNLWDDGVPVDIPHEHLCGNSWDPAVQQAALESIPGLGGSARVGVDGMSFSASQLILAALPGATLVDAEPVMIEARRVKMSEEVNCLRIATALAESALAATMRHVRPGVRARDLVGICTRRIVEAGVVGQPSFEGTFCVTSPRDGDEALTQVRELTSNRQLCRGDLVVMSSGALYAGYEGAATRTVACSDDGGQLRLPTELRDRHESLRSTLIQLLRPGTTGRDFLDVYRAAGEELPPIPVLHGLGLGMEPPIVDASLLAGSEPDWALEAGMVVTVHVHVRDPRIGSALAGFPVLITEDGHETLSR